MSSNKEIDIQSSNRISIKSKDGKFESTRYQVTIKTDPNLSSIRTQCDAAKGCVFEWKVAKKTVCRFENENLGTVTTTVSFKDKNNQWKTGNL